MPTIRFEAAAVECVESDEGLTALFLSGPPHSDQKLALSRGEEDDDVEIVLGAKEQHAAGRRGPRRDRADDRRAARPPLRATGNARRGALAA